MFGHPMVQDCAVDTETGGVLPVVTIVTDNGGPFRSFRFEAFIAAALSCTTSARRSALRAVRLTRTRLRDAEV